MKCFFLAGIVSSASIQKRQVLRNRLMRDVPEAEARSCHGSYCQNNGN